MLAVSEAGTPWRDRKTSTHRDGPRPIAKTSIAPEVRSQDELRAIFEQALPLIEQIIGGVARRHALSADDAQEFDARVKLRLLEDDHAVLQKWRRDAKLATFLSVVINHFLLDFRVEKWGRWRPSRKAKRLGQEAVVLETLVERDGHSLDEAIEIMHARRLSSSDRADLERLATQLPARCRRRFTGESSLQQLPARERVESRIEEEEKRAVVERVRAVFAQALSNLDDGDRMLLRLFYQEGITFKDIAVLLKISQRSIYSRHQRCLDGLRRSFEQAGLRWSAVKSIMGWAGTDLSLEALHKNRQGR